MFTCSVDQRAPKRQSRSCKRRASPGKHRQRPDRFHPGGAKEIGREIVTNYLVATSLCDVVAVVVDRGRLCQVPSAVAGTAAAISANERV
jgi:hypothetical protein